MEIFEETKNFPSDEKFALTDQIRRSSRSVVANLAEAWKKRVYQKAFVYKVVDCAGEAAETEVWLDMAYDAKYISTETHMYYRNGYKEVSKMLNSMIRHPEKFCR